MRCSPAGDLVELAPARAVEPARLDEVLIDAGPEQGARRVLAIGDGAVRYREAIGEVLAHVPPDESPLHLVDAAAGCELAALRRPGESSRTCCPTTDAGPTRRSR